MGAGDRRLPAARLRRRRLRRLGRRRDRRGGSDDERRSRADEPGTGSAGSPAGLLAGLEPPSGAKLLDERSRGDVVYRRYSSGETPREVEALYGEEVEAAGWSLVESGGSGGGWGPYGGADYGLTAKREDEYFDLQAGGEEGSTSYFEICATAGAGTRAECNELSDESNTSSGGSGSEESEGTTSGGS